VAARAATSIELCAKSPPDGYTVHDDGAEHPPGIYRKL
jgi:hypothetical protein